MHYYNYYPCLISTQIKVVCLKNPTSNVCSGKTSLGKRKVTFAYVLLWGKVGATLLTIFTKLQLSLFK